MVCLLLCSLFCYLFIYLFVYHMASGALPTMLCRRLKREVNGGCTPAGSSPCHAERGGSNKNPSLQISIWRHVRCRDEHPMSLGTQTQTHTHTHSDTSLAHIIHLHHSHVLPPPHMWHQPVYPTARRTVSQVHRKRVVCPCCHGTVVVIDITRFLLRSAALSTSALAALAL